MRNGTTNDAMLPTEAPPRSFTSLLFTPEHWILMFMSVGLRDLLSRDPVKCS
jgi:hypothetical protein